jgi:polar amino acid transport system substrate-binding protein
MPPEIPVTSAVRLRPVWRFGLMLAVTAILAGPLAGAAQPRKLRLGSTVWPPFTNAPGQARFAIDLVHEALGRLGITAETTIVADGALTPALLTGKFDGSAALWREEERERRLIYSQPYLQNRLVLVGRKGSDVAATTLAEVPGKRIALVEGFSYGDVLARMKGATYVPARSVEESLQQVLAGQADYTFLDELVVEYLLRTFPNETSDRLALGFTPLVVRSLHFAVRRDLSGAQSIVDRFNAELGQMVADRSYHRLLQIAWIEADVDGDGRTESVAASDQGGSKPPTRQYALVTSTTPAPKPPSQQRFYFGGQVYEGWSSVPERFKVGDPSKTPWGATVSPIFSFKW